MTLSDDLAQRGLIKDRTFEKLEWLDQPQVFYHGIDASSNSMQVGNLAAMMLARRFIDAGWQAVLLAGGATSLIGDPKGTGERELQPRDEIQKNVEAIKSQIQALFAGSDFTLVDNYDWFSDVKYLDFLRDVGKNFSMTELMQREFVAERMGDGASGISYAEFSYSLIQGYDFWQLYKKHNTVLQIGGSDQWGNMLSGVSLIRKKESADVQAMSMPLVINKATGIKFGKSELGSVWLDPQKTTPTQFYQFWINTDDADVEEYLKVFTLLSLERIKQVMSEHRSEPSKRIAQKMLADEITKIVHGDSRAASDVTRYLTSQVSLTEASSEDLSAIRSEIPSVKSNTTGSIVEALVKSGLAQSNTDARRLASAGAVYVNGQPVKRDNFEQSDFRGGRLLLRRGKAYKDSALVELES